jgi:hypothetical protein
MQRNWIGALIGITAVAIVGIGVALLFWGQDDGAGPTPSASGVGLASPEVSEQPSQAADAGASPTAPATPAPIAGPWTITWTRVEGLETGAEVNAVQVIGDTWFAAGSMAGTAAIWSSTDGASWGRAEVGQPSFPEGTPDQYFVEVADLTAIGDSLLAVGGWGRRETDQYAWAAWLSNDGGATWQTTTPGEGIGLIAVSPGGPGAVAVEAGTPTFPYDSVLRSTADGQSWQAHSPEAWAVAQVLDLGAAGDRLIAVGSDLSEPGSPGVGTTPPLAWFSDDGGTTWTQVALPLVSGNGGIALSVATAGGGPLVAVGSSREIQQEPPYPETAVATAWVSTDGGQTWSAQALGGNGYGRGVATAPGGMIAVGTTGTLFESGQELAWSSGDGVTWQDAGPIGAGDLRLSTVAVRGRVVVAGGDCPRFPPDCGSPLWRGEIAE